jgi:hypothetical protein
MNDREIIALKEVNEAIIKRLQRIEEGLISGHYKSRNVKPEMIFPYSTVLTIQPRRHGRTRVQSAFVPLETVGLIPYIGMKVKVTIEQPKENPEPEKEDKKIVKESKCATPKDNFVD